MALQYQAGVGISSDFNSRTFESGCCLYSTSTLAVSNLFSQL
jgi:hypothetical protein